MSRLTKMAVIATVASVLAVRELRRARMKQQTFHKADDVIVVSTPISDAHVFTPSHIRACLSRFLVRDVLAIVLSYVPRIEGNFVRTWSATEGVESPRGICLHNHELFLADSANSRIQVFHAPTGRYLRSWSTIVDGGQPRSPFAVAVSGAEVFVTDDLQYDVQVFSSTDSRLV